jgi:serine protease Do
MRQTAKILAKRALLTVVGAALLGGIPALAARRGASHAAQGQFTPGYLGVYLRGVDAQTAAHLKLKDAKGAEIMGVDRDAPAGKVGLRPHDVIVGINGHPIANEQQVRQILHGIPAGRTIHLRIIRSGKSKSVTVKLASQAEVEAEAWPKGVIFTDGFPALRTGSGLAGNPFSHIPGSDVKLREFAIVGCDGMEVEPISRQLANYFGAPRGTGLLVRTVEPHSNADAAGLQAGDVIVAANGMPSGTLRGWLMVMSQNQGKAVKLKVLRNGKLMQIRYVPGSRKQQSRLSVPAGLEIFAGRQEPTGTEMWFWSESSWTQRSIP